MGWNKDYPLSTTRVSGSTEQIRANWEAIEEWWDVEHQTFTSAGSGEHTIGRFPALYYGSDAGSDAVTNPGTGAGAYATDTGVLKIVRAGAWERLTEDAFSRVRNVATGTAANSGEWTVITTWESTGASGMYDTLNEWASSKFTATSTGYYLVYFHARWDTEDSDFTKALGLFRNDVLHTIVRTYGQFITSMDGYDIVYLTAGQYLQLAVWHNKSTEDHSHIVSANIHIHRIS